jgi:hypothetical protein
MAPMAQGEYVVVWFSAPSLGTDPDDSVAFTSDRHKVPARWARQDAHETVFIDDLGVIVGRWPTASIRRIEWPDVAQAGEDKDARRERWAEKLAKVRETHPQAWTKWTDDEDARLAAEFDAGLTVEEMADGHGRARGGIVSRLVKLELVERGTSEAAIDAR